MSKQDNSYDYAYMYKETADEFLEALAKVDETPEILNDPDFVQHLTALYNTLRHFSDEFSKTYSETRKAILAEIEPYKMQKDLAKKTFDAVKRVLTQAAVRAYATNGVKRQGDITLRVKRGVRVVDPDALAKALHGVLVDGKPIVTWQPVIDEKMLLRWYDRQEGFIPPEIEGAFEVVDDYSIAVGKVSKIAAQKADYEESSLDVFERVLRITAGHIERDLSEHSYRKKREEFGTDTRFERFSLDQSDVDLS